MKSTHQHHVNNHGTPLLRGGPTEAIHRILDHCGGDKQAALSLTTRLFKTQENWSIGYLEARTPVLGWNGKWYWVGEKVCELEATNHYDNTTIEVAECLHCEARVWRLDGGAGGDDTADYPHIGPYQKCECGHWLRYVWEETCEGPERFMYPDDFSDEDQHDYLYWWLLDQWPHKVGDGDPVPYVARHNTHQDSWTDVWASLESTDKSWEGLKGNSPALGNRAYIAKGLWNWIDVDNDVECYVDQFGYPYAEVGDATFSCANCANYNAESDAPPTHWAMRDLADHWHTLFNDFDYDLAAHIKGDHCFDITDDEHNVFECLLDAAAQMFGGQELDKVLALLRAWNAEVERVKKTLPAPQWTTPEPWYLADAMLKTILIYTADHTDEQ